MTKTQSMITRATRQDILILTPANLSTGRQAKRLTLRDQQEVEMLTQREILTSNTLRLTVGKSTAMATTSQVSQAEMMHIPTDLEGESQLGIPLKPLITAVM